MLNDLLYLALRSLTWVVPRAPVRILYWLADVAGTLAYLFLPHIRTLLLANLAQALPEATLRERQRSTRNAFCNDAKNWIDTLRIPSMSGHDLHALVQVDGWDRLEAAVDGGRGAIIVTMHLGNFDLVGQLLAARGWRLTVPVERMHPARLFEFLVATRASRGISLVPVEQAPRAMIGALARRELVGLAIDRHVAGKSMDVRFFGRVTQFPRGFASLVRHAQVPVLMGVGIRLPSGRFQGYVSGPFAMDLRPGLEAERVNIETVVAEMERLIRRFPDQWLAFWPVWPVTEEVNTPDRVEERSEAAT